VDANLDPLAAAALALESLALAALYARYSLALTAANPLVWVVFDHGGALSGERCARFLRQASAWCGRVDNHPSRRVRRLRNFES
jgi:hypothetical protein